MGEQSKHEAAECRELFARLSAYLDGELGPESRAQVEAHLCDCHPCVEFVESLRRTVGLCHGFDADAQPPQISPAQRADLLDVCLRALARRNTTPAV